MSLSPACVVGVPRKDETALIHLTVVPHHPRHLSQIHKLGLQHKSHKLCHQ
jgi:hypothetical protein